MVILALIAAATWLFTGQDPASPDATGDPERTADEPVDPSVVPSLAEDDASWEQAVRADTAAAYRAYLLAFPNGKRVDDARAQLAILDQLEVVDDNAFLLNRGGPGCH